MQYGHLKRAAGQRECTVGPAGETWKMKSDDGSDVTRAVEMLVVAADARSASQYIHLGPWIALASAATSSYPSMPCRPQ